MIYDRPPGLPNETLVGFLLLPHSSLILERFDARRLRCLLGRLILFHHLQPTVVDLSFVFFLEAHE